ATPIPYSPGREWFIDVLEVRPTLIDRGPEDSPPTEVATRKWPLTFHVFAPGTYTIGSPPDEPDRRPKEEHRREVQIVHPFAVLDRELTMQELIDFNPKFEQDRQSYPSELAQAAHSVDWYDAVACCLWMSTQAQWGESAQAYPDPARLDPAEHPREPTPSWNWAPRNWPLRLDRPGYRLPTESEWEIACRSSLRTPYPHGGDAALVSRFGWTTENSQRRHHVPRELRPTLRGLYDVQGNVLEWTHDWFAENPREILQPTGPATGDERTLRGGSGVHGAIYCRAASRYASNPTDGSYLTGLRPARSLVAPPPAGD
ncbi:MAG: formylglycine-generating enzyme family protein, partial [Planctomycetaceae bacterium]